MLNYGYALSVFGNVNTKKSGNVSRETCEQCGQFTLVVLSVVNQVVSGVCGNDNCKSNGGM